MNKLNISHKLFFFIKVCLILIAVCLKSYSENSNALNKTVVIGSDDAKIKIKIFSSFTCPHCANFHNKVLPEIKKEYVNTGKAQIIFIDFPLDQAAFNAAKLLHCLQKEKQIEFLDTIYGSQSKWAAGEDIIQINNKLKKIVKNLGINSNKFDKCLIDEKISDKILNSRIDASQKYSIDSTPTVIINEKKLKDTSFKNIKKRIERLI